MNEIEVVELWPRWAECWACGADTPCHWGLPIDTCAVLVPNDYEGEWGGVPACRECYEAHAQGILTADTLAYWRRRMELARRAMDHLIVRE